MQEREWIGLQFNWFEGDKKPNLKPWLADFASVGIETDGEHITLHLDPQELADWRGAGSFKIDLAKNALKRYLALSEFTVLYANLDASDLVREKAALMRGELETSLDLPDPSPDFSILDNIFSCVESPAVRNVLASSPLIPVLNEFFMFVVNRNFATDQSLSLSLEYEAEEAWDPSMDNLCLAIELET